MNHHSSSAAPALAQAAAPTEISSLEAAPVEAVPSEAIASSPALTVEHLVKQYPHAADPVLRDISFSVPRGQVVVVLGPSGSGKSTLLRAIAGLEPIQGGDIKLNGAVIAHGAPLASSKRAARAAFPAPKAASMRTSIGMVFQSYDLFPHKTVIDNIMLAPLLVQHREKAEVRAAALALLERVGLADRANAWPHELSGGQRQRVAICRALIVNPEVMLFDEVTAALDPEMVHEVLDVIVELADQGLTMLIVTHEMSFARAVADRILLLDQGGIVEESSEPDAFFEHPRSARARQFLRTFSYERSSRQQS